MFKKVILIIFFIMITFSSYAAAAVTDRVVFYPSSADISRVVTADIIADNSVANSDKIATFILPGQAVPESFSIKPQTNGVVINDVSWSRDNLAQPPAAVDIENKIKLLTTKLMIVKAQIQAVEGGILFWNERSKIQQSKLVEVEKIADLVISNLSKLYKQSVDLNAQGKEISAQIDELNRKLKEVSGQDKNRWVVTAYVKGIKSKHAAFKINYMLRNCGWRPKYKLDAYPNQKKVNFTFDAEIWQGSGMDFNNFDVALATVKENSRIFPPELSLWRIAPQPTEPVQRKFARSMAVMETATTNDVVAVAPELVKKSTYSIWELGVKNIAAGPARRYSILSEIWNVEYSFLSRPSITSDVYVSAKIKLKDAKDYPDGQALMLMEGAMLGKIRFSFFGNDKTFFFGADPLLKAERKTLDNSSGDAGIFGSKQTYKWKYSISLTNSRGTDVVIKVQEPAPSSGDKRIKLSDSANPKAIVKDNNFEWDIVVPAKQKAEIQYDIDLNAPEDMKIDFGLGR